MSCTDKNIIDLINKHDLRGETQTVKCLYKCIKPAASVLIKHGVSDGEERKTFVHLAIVEFIILVRKSKFKLTGEAKICTYLTEVARRIWLAHWKKEKKEVDFPQEDLPQAQEDEGDNEKERSQVVKDAIQKLNATEQEIIKAYYYYGVTLKEYAENKGISAASARKRVTRARQRIKELIKEQLL